MILPIITAISREVFLQTPRLHEEAALALGATRWEMIRYAVFPYARSGMVSGIMLGLGRALGETMAVAMVLATTPLTTLNVIGTASPPTIAANIALNYKEATPERQSLLIATGLVLFVVTFLVNFAARWVSGRQCPQDGADDRRDDAHLPPAAAALGAGPGRRDGAGRGRPPRPRGGLERDQVAGSPRSPCSWSPCPCGHGSSRAVAPRSTDSSPR